MEAEVDQMPRDFSASFGLSLGYICGQQPPSSLFHPHHRLHHHFLSFFFVLFMPFPYKNKTHSKYLPKISLTLLHFPFFPLSKMCHKHQFPCLHCHPHDYISITFTLITYLSLPITVLGLLSESPALPTYFKHLIVGFLFPNVGSTYDRELSGFPDAQR